MSDVDHETGEVLDTKALPSTTVSSSLAVALARAELDQQITTAKAFPRSYQKFLDESKQLVCLNAEIAESCNYALPRGGKRISGPSVRFAEIIQGRYGNCMAAARVIGEDGDYIVAEGIFQDLETMSITRTQTRRRIVDKNGKKYNVDMVGVTGNAACQIAKRNAILQGISKALYDPLYQAALHVIRGDMATLESRRAKVMESFKKLGVTEKEIFAVVGVEGIADVGLDEMATLNALGRQIQNGETSVKEAFRPEPEPTPSDETKRKVESELKQQGADPAAQKKAPEPEREPLDLQGGEALTASAAIARIRGCQTKAELERAWKDIRKAYKDAGQEVPIEVDGARADRLEYLAQQGA